MNENTKVIRTHPARSEYSYDEVGREPYNAKLMHFVHHELNECMKAAYPGIKGLRYVEDMTDMTFPDRPVSYKRAVIIAFDNGYRKVANVEGDSEFGAIEDVMKAISR